MGRPAIQKTRHKATPGKLSKSSVENCAPPAVKPPTTESIARRAYEIWLLRDRRHGSDWQDWFEAEKQLVQNSALDVKAARV